MTTVSPYPKVASDSLGAVLLIEVATGIVVQANHVAQQLAPDVPLPVSLERWFDAADLRVDTGSRLHSSEHLLWSIAQGEQVAGLTVTARRSSAQSEAREPLSVYGLPLHGALDLLGHALVLLLPVRYGDPDDEELVAAATDLRHRALLATALAFTLVDARDPELPLTWVNPAFTATTGYTSDEVLGRNCRFLQGPNTDPEQVTRIRRALAAGTDVSTVLVNYRKDGTAFWNQLTITPVLDDAGAVTHFVGIQADVTERVESDHALQRSLKLERAARREAQEARASAERATDRLTLVADATVAMSESTDVPTSLKQLAAVLIPRVADWVIISLVDERGALKQVVTQHRDGHRELLAQWESLQPQLLSERSATRTALRTGRSQLLADHNPQAASGGVSEAWAHSAEAMFEELGLAASLVVPLRLGSKVTGTLALMMSTKDRTFDADDIAGAELLASRAALTIEHTRLLQETQDRAEVLQRSLLPELPHIAGVQLAAAYLPSNHTAEIGGDWWDVFALTDEPGNPIALAIGDVMGHDIGAAAAMGQLRSVLRTCAWMGDSPTAVLERMDRLVQQFEMAQLATCIYARLEPAEGDRPHARLTYSNAGHLPPLLLSPDGSVQLLDGGAGAPIGAPGPPRPEHASCEVRRAAPCCSTPTGWSSPASTTSTRTSNDSGSRWPSTTQPPGRRR